MIKGIDPQALVDQFAKVSARQGEALRRAVAESTLKALQGRELTLANIRSVLRVVMQAALRNGRALGRRTSQARLASCSALFSGVSIGMTQGTSRGQAAAPAGAPSKPAARKR